MFETLLQDLRYTIRGLRAKPAFATAVVVTLALGIGANAAMFGIVDRMLFRPPAMLITPELAHRIYVYQTYRGQENASGGYQYARYVDLANKTTSFDLTAGYARRDIAVGVGESAREMSIAAVSASFFKFFDAPAEIGRYFTSVEDSVPSGEPVAVLSHAFWSTKFGERKDAIGSKIQIGPTIFTVVGVAPKGFVGLWADKPPAAFIPITNYASTTSSGFGWLTADRPWWKSYNWGWMSMIARRKPGISIDRANADLTQAMRLSYIAATQGAKATPIEVAKPHAAISSILAERGPNASSVTKVATWVGGVSIIVLLIACANVANLLLARALRRRREVAVRLALGVTRRRLFSQLLVESVVLAMLGGIAGMLVAKWGGGMLRAALFTKSAPTAVFGDPRMILFAGGVALLVGLLTGLAPMLQATRGKMTLAEDLRSGAREGTYHRSRIRTGLLIVQGALSVILLVGAGLFVRSLDHVKHLRLGYDVDPVSLVDINMRGVKLDSAQRGQLRERLLTAARRVPGVTHASRTASVPFWSTWSVGLTVAGIDTVGRLGQFNLNAIDPDFFATFGTRVVRGRAFTNQDSRMAPKVMIVSQGMAKRLWPGKDPIGQCVRVNRDTMPCTTVVGVSEDIRQQTFAGDSGVYIYYLPNEQFEGDAYLMIRSSGSAAHQAEAIRRALQREMPGASYVTVTPFSDIIGGETKSWQLGATMFTAFGILALLLAAIGLYSVIAYNVAQRTHEMGVRIALGAQMGDVIRLVVSDGVRLGVIGLAIGAAIALGAARWVKPLLFEQSARDPLVFATVTIVLLVVTIVASWIPARRAAKVDPQLALRSE